VNGLQMIVPGNNLTRQEVRRRMIDMALRRARPGTGSSQEFMRRRTAMQKWPDLRPILADVDWVIAGAVATRAFMPERVTHDLDVLARASDEKLIIDRLQTAGFELVGSLAIPGYAFQTQEGDEVDILLGSQPWLEEALAAPAQDSAGLPVLALPYLVLMKLESGRVQDLADVTRMLGWADDETLAVVRDVVTRHRPVEIEDIESFIYLGRLERGE
jgi:hypothetical protein